MVNQISRIKIDRDIQILLQVTQNGKYLVLKIYEFNFKIKIYREEKNTTWPNKQRLEGGAVDMERKSYEYETIFSFHKDGASVWWPEPSHKRVHHGAKLGIIQFVWLELKF